MNIETFLTSTQITRDDLKDRTVIVIDVFRASTTIVEALNNGARAIVPVSDMEEAGKSLSEALEKVGGPLEGGGGHHHHLH